MKKRMKKEKSAKGNNNGKTSEQMWQKIGVHRPIASFWYQFVILVIMALPAILIGTYVIPNFVLPYPEALGYQSLTVTYFGLFFTLMDVSTGPAIERFVAQYAEVDPQQTAKYVQFFVWFQIATGLIQMTGVAIYCFVYVVNTDIVYAMWFFLLYSTTQYPGMLNVFYYTLNGYQRYDKSSIIVMIQTVFFENFTKIIFILIGRWLGGRNPAIGELYGATMGFIIGVYLDDFFALGLSARFVGKIVEPYGLKVKDLIIPAFTMKEVKECLSFGIKLIGAELISVLTDFLTLTMMITWVPNYISILAYITIAKNVAYIVDQKFNFKAMLSEAYNNGKRNLTQYLINSSFRNWWLIAFFLAIITAIIVPSFLEILGGEWGRAAWIIPFYVFPRLFVGPTHIGTDILIGCDKPFYRTLGIVSEKITKMIAVFLFVSPWGLVSILGSDYMIILFVLHDIPAYIVIGIVQLFFIQKKIVKVKINWWQSFGATTLATVCLIPLSLLLRAGLVYSATVLDLIWVFGIIAVVVFLMFIVFPLLTFFLSGVFGGWDETILQEYKDAIKIGGPSKFIIRGLYKWSAMGHRLCPFKDKFQTDSTLAYQELKELNEMKMEVFNDQQIN
jgi:O-antigen/teichoic acid export membrane protein